MTRVLILGGGPDAERDISIASATAIHQACLDAGLNAQLKIIDRPSLDEVRSWQADVIFPALHGRFGEGGGLQALLEQAGHAFIGSKSQASRLAMDKMGTKLIASCCSISTPAASIFEPTDAEHPLESVCPLEMPVVIKPVADGSSVGLHLCHDEFEWRSAVEKIGHDLIDHPHRVYMIERMVQGRELTVSVLANETGELQALPIIEISPAEGLYDFEAKYTRNDTVYTSNPDLADGIAAGMKEHALRVCAALGVRHLGRVDYIFAQDDHWAMLEVNTMPGFTATSLMPMAAKANSITMPDLCVHLVNCAIKDHAITNPGLHAR